MNSLPNKTHGSRNDSKHSYLRGSFRSIPKDEHLKRLQDLQ